MNTWSWIKRLRRGNATEITPSLVTRVPDFASQKDSTETDSSSYESPPEVQALSALSTPPAFVPSSAVDADAAVPAVWHVGDVFLGQYEVMDILGEGGMGTVYKVRHRGWNTDLAVKSPKPQIFARADGKENFIREAETWVNLGLHPHIVSCYYVRTLGGIPRVFAEYVAGGSLADWIRTHRLYEGGHKQALERLLDVAIQFAWGLHYAHEQRLVHQDVKPANVMMTPDGIAKVTDFGLAKARAMAGEEGVLSGEQSILVSWAGMTPAYCSPEQAARQPLSRKTDIWSWAVSILHMFIGEVTWMAGVVAREALARHVGQDKGIPAMPAQLVKLLTRCFQPRPEDRPATMLEIAVALQEIYAREIGQPSLREEPRSVEMLADSLNNWALSLFDLGKVEAAKQVWSQALQADPHHLEATYNRGLIRWRAGEMTDDVLVRQLEEVRVPQDGRWQALYLQAQIHLERGEVEVARTLLQQGAAQAPNEAEIQLLLGQAQFGTLSKGDGLRTFQGHTWKVAAVSLSADGRLALSGGHDHTLRLWETSSGRCLQTFIGHSDWVESVSLSADGRLALSGDVNGTVRLWKVADGRCLRTFQGHTWKVAAVSLSTDGRRALSGSEDGTVRLWEVTSGLCLRTFTGHTGAVSSVSLSADGHLALSGSMDGTVRLWEVRTGRWMYTFKEHMRAVTGVSLSADGRRALSGSEDGTVRLWEVTSGRCLRTFTGHTKAVTGVMLSTDGHLALSGSEDGTVRLWEVTSGRCLRTFTGHTGAVTAVSLSADGHLALSGGGRDRTVRLWEIPRERFFCTLRLSRVWSHTDLSQIASRGETLLAQAEYALQEARFPAALALVRQVRDLSGWERSPKSMEAWAKLSRYCMRVGLRGSSLLSTFTGHTGAVTAVSLSADGRLCVLGRGDGTVQLWEVTSGNLLSTLNSRWEKNAVNTVSLSADGHLALSGSEDGTVWLWEVTSGRCLRTFTGHTGAVSSVSLSADGRFALSGGHDHTLRLWETSSGRCLRIFQGHTHAVTAVSLSTDGRLCVSGGGDGTVQLWEVTSGNLLSTLKGGGYPVFAVSLSADGHLCVSRSADGTAQLWEVATVRYLRIFQGHTGAVSSVSLSADGRFALSGGHDHTLRLWETSSGRCLRIFQGHTGAVRSVNLSADGHFALSGGDDQTMRLWELDWDLEARDPADWDEGALSYLEIFLTQHTPYAGVLPQYGKPSEQEIPGALTRRGRPSWSEQDFQELIRHLQYVGYGWLRAEGMRRKLEELAVSWQEPPPLLNVRGQVVEWPLPLPKRGISRRTVILGLIGLTSLTAVAGGITALTKLAPHPLYTYMGHSDTVYAVAWSPDGKRIASGSYDKTVQVWDAIDGGHAFTYRGHSSGADSVAWSPDGRRIASGSFDKTVQVWDAIDGGHAFTYRGHSSGVDSVAWSPDGRRIASGSFDKTVQVWDAIDGGHAFTYRGHSSGADSVAWSPDGRRIASGSDDKTVQVWDAIDGGHVYTYRGHSDMVYAVAWSPDGRRIASGSFDNTVQVWDAADGGHVYSYQGHFSFVFTVAWSPDGGRIASGAQGPDQTVQIWDAANGENVNTYSTIHHQVTAMAWSPDGRRIALGDGYDQTVQVWQVF